MREIGKGLKENQTVFYREKYTLGKQYENKGVKWRKCLLVTVQK